MELKAHVAFMPVLIEMVDAFRGEDARTAHDAVDAVALLQQQLGQVRTVLPGDACD